MRKVSSAAGVLAAVVATERGASLALAGLIAAMLMVGELVADLPAGWLVARIGERIAMIRYEISDIRLFYENNVRFLQQF